MIVVFPDHTHLLFLYLRFPMKAFGQLGHPSTADEGMLPGRLALCKQVDILLDCIATKLPPTPGRIKTQKSTINPVRGQKFYSSARNYE